MRIISSVGASVGRDHGSAVSSRYSAPFAFTGILHEVVIQLPEHRSRILGGGEAKADEAATARTEMSRQ
ncbi:MAG: hypothetical protein CL468_07965 [Acidimicrobiaceae bacterium]|nr:hypothetical protein [Acidimicrobiaceae bacterium]